MKPARPLCQPLLLFWYFYFSLDLYASMHQLHHFLDQQFVCSAPLYCACFVLSFLSEVKSSRNIVAEMLPTHTHAMNCLSFGCVLRPCIASEKGFKRQPGHRGPGQCGAFALQQPCFWHGPLVTPTPPHLWSVLLLSHSATGTLFICLQKLVADSCSMPLKGWWLSQALKYHII